MSFAPTKAFLLAAGQGTRLRPLTDTTPKCLLPIGGVPMLQIWLSRCEAFGIREVLINLHAHSDVVRDFVRRNAVPDVRVMVSDEPVLLGSAGTIRENRKWVRDQAAFWVFYADVLTHANLEQMASFHARRDAAATIGLYRVPDPARCGIVQVDDSGWVTEFIEKPKMPVGNLAFSGILLGGPEFLDALPTTTPSDIGFHVLPQLVGRMLGYEIREYLIDIGTMENYQAAQKDWSAMQPACQQERHA